MYIDNRPRHAAAVCLYIVALLVYFTYGIHHSKLNDAEYHRHHVQYVQLDEVSADEDDDATSLVMLNSLSSSTLC